MTMADGTDLGVTVKDDTLVNVIIVDCTNAFLETISCIVL